MSDIVEKVPWKASDEIKRLQRPQMGEKKGGVTMKWTEIDYDGTTIYAADFYGGVWVSFGGLDPITRTPYPGDASYIPGYYVQQERGDTDGPVLRERPTEPLVFSLKIVGE